MEHDYAIPFEELSRASVAVAGGKGAQLGELARAGIPVPPGFVLSTHAFDVFLAENKLAERISRELSLVDPKRTETVNAASARIRKLIESAPTPAEIGESALAHFELLSAKFVAVRSSATAEDASAASWAGELETYLNTTRESLLSHTKKCWSSLFTPRAIFYRFEKGLAQSNVSVGVVVQKMVQSDVAGVAFTVNPVTQNRGEMIIEAAYGLGEALVSGMVTPDTYTVDKAEGMLLDVNIGEQEKMIVKREEDGRVKNAHLEVAPDARGRQKLSGKQVLELAELCAGIERHYGSPQDIEWALEGGKFYVVQSRPVTTLK